MKTSRTSVKVLLAGALIAFVTLLAATIAVLSSKPLPPDDPLIEGAQVVPITQ